MEDSQPCVAVVTGAARRVGKAIALRLAHIGYDLAITYHQSAGDADDVVKEIEQVGRRAIALRADLRDPARMDDIAARALRLGQVRVLVNNASIYEPAEWTRVDAVAMRAAYAVHVESPLRLCQRLETSLRANHGYVINMVDLLAEKPWPRYLAYCASKAALANLTLSLAKALAPEVRVNGIAPGVVEWPEDYPEAEREKYLRRVPLGRAGTAEDVAKLVGYLVADTYMTGQILQLDGGRSVT